MHETELPTSTDDTGPDGDGRAADAELDEIAADFDTVEEAMRALDAEELDRAEAHARSLGLVADQTDTASGEALPVAEPDPGG